MRGLRAPAVVLLLALTLFVAFSPTAQALRNTVFDAYQRLFPLERDGRHVAVVLIDEGSIARYGQWPWPRTRIGELLEAIAKQKPLAVGLDLFFPEPDRFSPAALASELPLMTTEVRRALEGMPSNDQRFAEAIRGHPIVLGIAAQQQPNSVFASAPVAAPARVGEHAIDELPLYRGHIGNVPVVDQAAAGRGAMNAGEQDQVVRVVPLVLNVQGTVVPSLGVETLRVAAEAGLTLSRLHGGLLRLSFDQVDVRLQDDGRSWLRVSRHDDGGTVLASDVLAGTIAPETFASKVVLVGMSGAGVLDFKNTPLGEFIPGVYMHAHVVENLLANVSLVRPDTALWSEALLLLACGTLLIVWVPRLSALQGINLALLLVLLLLGTGVVAFLHFGVLFDPAWPAIGTVAVFGSVVVGTLSEADRQRRVLREQAAHMAGEVDAARRIQMGLLPDPREVAGNDPRFGLAAMLEPARTVGGDFYDCFRADERHVFVVVADVSGKGLPAALFMAAVKSHVKSAAVRGGSVGDVLTRAQAEIARENPEQLFVTAFAASLDLDSGVLEYANAGHEPPFARRPEGRPERVDGSGGPPLCVVEEFAYPTQKRQLRRGECVVIVTDGATEAMNPASEFYGVERLKVALSRVPDGAPPADVLAAVRSELAAFTAGAEPSDDVTLMALRWN